MSGTRSARPRPTAVLALASLVAWLSACATPMSERSWTRLHSDHFEILSMLPVDQTKRLALELETFRNVVLLVTNAVDSDEPVPTQIVLLRNRLDVQRLGPGRTLDGYFLSTARRNFAVLAGASARARPALFHEYAHFLVNAHDRNPRPTWLNEGFAETLATLALQGDQVVLGKADPERLLLLLRQRWLPLEDVIRTRGTQDLGQAALSMFYAQSWALVHYLQWGRAESDLPAMSEQTTTYVTSLAAGADPLEAFETSFALRVDELERSLHTYVSGRRPAFALERERFAPAPVPEPEPFATADAEVLLGELARQLGLADAAALHFESALTDDPGAARAWSGLGSLQASASNWSAADASFAKALELGSDDALVHLDYAIALQQRAEQAQETEQAQAQVAEARRHYTRSWELDRTLPETYAAYGSTFLLPGADPKRGVGSLRHAHALLPSNLGIRLTLAKLLVRTGDTAEARSLADSVIGLAVVPESVEAAREIRAEIEAGRAEPASDQVRMR